ncbi:hypothetical protein ACQ0MK_11525 [Thalassospira lucentensis]|uniref:hypothetical protein n=1 Tax=Thalassospira lucentensis TaxID=168935 RepID=UPI003D2F02DE
MIDKTLINRIAHGVFSPWFKKVIPARPRALAAPATIVRKLVIFRSWLMGKRTQFRNGTHAGLPPACCPKRVFPLFKPDEEFYVLRKSVLLIFTLIGLGVAAYFILPLTPIPGYIDGVLNRFELLF